MNVINIYIRAAAVVLPVIIIATLLARDSGSLSNRHTWHPILMTAGFVFFLTNGIATYTLGTNTTLEARAARRTLHGALQFTGMLCAVAGWLFMMFHKLDTVGGTTALLGANAHATTHAVIGYLTLLLTFVQVLVGIRKFWALKVQRRAIFRWHSLLGMLVYLLGIVNLNVGAFLWWKGATGWFGVVSWVVLLLSLGLLLLTFYRIFLGPMRGHPAQLAIFAGSPLLQPSVSGHSMQTLG